MKPQEAETILRVLDSRLPVKATAVELSDGDIVEVRDYFTGRDFGDEFDNLYINWSSEDSEFISVTDILKVLDLETNTTVFEVQSNIGRPA